MTGSIASGARWSLLAGIVARLVGPAFLVVLARILTPDDFGLMAVAMVVIAFATLFQDLGLKQALVQRKEVDQPLLLTGFWGSAGMGVFWFTVVWLAAPWIADAYRNPDVIPVVRALSAVFLVSPLGTVPEALLLRDLDFRRLFRVELVPSLVPGAVAVVLGLTGFGVWSLVWGQVAGAVLRTVTLWSMVSWRPTGGPPKGEWRHLTRFGGWISLEALLAWSITYLDQAFAGRFLSLTGVGYYRMGVALALLPARGISQVLGRVLLPAYSRHQDDPARLREALERCVHIVALATVPVGAAAVAFSDVVVPLVLGERWRAAVPVLQVLAVAGVLSALVNVAPPLYKAIGRVDIMPKFFLARAAVSIPVYWFAAQRGLLPLVTAKLLLTCLFAPANLTIAVLVFRASGRRVLTAVATTAGAAAGAAVLGTLAGHVAGDLMALPPWGATGIAVCVFASAYPLLVAGISASGRRELVWLTRTITGLR